MPAIMIDETYYLCRKAGFSPKHLSLHATDYLVYHVGCYPPFTMD